MTDIREKQTQEAVRRMKMLRLHPNAINDFKGATYENDGEKLINYSEYGVLYWIEDEEWKNIIATFEEEYDCVVYHAILSHTTCGDMLSLLYVSSTEEEWDMDRRDMMYGYVYAYVSNLSCPSLSEIGSICIEPRFGGVIRTA